MFNADLPSVHERNMLMRLVVALRGLRARTPLLFADCRGSGWQWHWLSLITRPGSDIVFACVIYF